MKAASASKVAMIKIYFDVCCINRPFDDQTQDRVHLEAEAVVTILKHIESGDWSWIGSGVVNYEVNKTSDDERRKRLQTLVRGVSVFIAVGNSTLERAENIQQLGINTYDALHLACAEQGNADVFLSTDSQLVKIAKRHQNKINVKVDNPLVWLQEVI